MILKRLGGVFGFGLAGLVCLVACQTLPDTGTCGNDLVEVELGEACDGTSTLAGAMCNASCQYACTPKGALGDSPAAQVKCPGGYYCGRDSICRAPSGEFTRGLSTPSDAYRVDLADIDGDGSQDLIATSAGLTRVHFARGADFDEVTEIPNTGSSPIVAQLTSTQAPGAATSRIDLQNDLLFPANQIAVWQGLPRERTLAPIQYSSLVFGSGAKDFQIIPADTHASIIVPGANRAATPGDETYLFVPRPNGSDIEFRTGGFALTPIQGLRGPADQIARAVRVEDLDGDTCPELVYGFLRGSIGAATPGVDVFFPCRAIPNGVLPAARLAADAAPAVRFPTVQDRPSARYVVGDQGVLVADFDGDGKPDILVHAEVDTSVVRDQNPAILVAYGVGDGRFQSTPIAQGVTGDGLATKLDSNALELPTASNGRLVFPLAAAQLTNRGKHPDKLCDFVLPDGIVFRTVGDQDGGTAQKVEIKAPEGVPWTEAQIGDFNLDGILDIVAGSSSALDFFSGTGEEPLVMTPFRHPVLNGAANFAAADFDGDQATDIAFSSGNDLFVAFGAGRGSGPSAPVRVGQFPSIHHVTAGSLPERGLPDGLADIAVVGKDIGESDAPFLSVLSGSVGRKLVSPLQLHVEGSPDLVLSTAASVGNFDSTSPGLDIAAIGVIPRDTTGAFSLWNIPLTGDARVITNSVTQEVFSSSALGGAVGELDWNRASTAALDLDAAGQGGGLDEVVVAVPPKKETGSEEQDVTRAGALLVVRLQDGKWTTQSLDTLGGGKGSAASGLQWKLRATDIDNDGAKDLVALFYQGGDANPVPKLHVHFNDRTGKLGEPITLEVPGQNIVDCAWLRADELSTNQDKKDLAVLTQDAAGRYALFIIKSDKTKRGFQAPKAVGGDLSDLVASGGGFRASLAAGDVNADGVDDILVANGSAYTVFLGRAR